MTIELAKGANTVLPGHPEPLTVVLEWTPKPGQAAPLDVCGFLLNDQEQVRSALDFVSRQRPLFPSGALRLEAEDEAGRHGFQVRLAALPASVAKIVFAMGLSLSAKTAWNFSQLDRATIRIISGTDEWVRYEIDIQACTETALIFGELYRHGDNWKFRAVGQGFVGGLAPLAQRYGANLEAPPLSAPPPPPPPVGARGPIPKAAPEPVRTARPVKASPAPKRSRGVKLLLAGTAGAAVLMLTQCDGDDQVRYQYSNLRDCVDEWGDDDYCYYDDGHYYAPTRTFSGTSYAKRKKISKGKPVSISRGGFGRTGSFFSRVAS